MGEVTEADIAAEQRVFGPGLGKLQARNRIIQRRFFAAQPPARAGDQLAQVADH